MAEHENEPQNVENQSQNIVEWRDEHNRRHFAGEGTFAHRQQQINEKAEAPTEVASGEKAPDQLTSTPGGKPAGPPKDPAPKPA